MFEFIVLFGLETERKEEREHCARRNLKTEVSLWKRISVHTRAKEKKATVTGHFGLMLGENHTIIVEKLCF